MNVVTVMLLLLLLLGQRATAQTRVEPRGNVGAAFDCNRHGQSCAQGSCQPGQPLCGCSSNVGSSCHLNSSVSPCTSGECNGNGYCGTGFCVCYENYYGDDCEHFFLSGEWRNDSMVLVANPYGDFGGTMYIYNKSGIADCQFIPLDELEAGAITDSTLQGYGLVVNHTGPCGDIVPVETDGITSYTRYVLIAFSPGIETSLDIYAKYEFTFNNTDEVVMAANVTILREPSYFANGVVTTQFKPTQLVATLNGVVLDIDDEVQLDQSIDFELTVTSDFQGVGIRNIWIENGKTGADFRTHTLFEEGCKQPAFEGILGDITYTNVGGIATATFESFALRFQNSDRLILYVTAKVCINEIDCDVPCPPPSGSATAFRKRRSAPDDPTASVAIRVGTMKDGTVILESDQRSDVDASRSGESATVLFIPTVIGLSVAAAILLTVGSCVMICALRRKSKVHGNGKA